MKKPASKKFTKTKSLSHHKKEKSSKKQFPINSRTIPERLFSTTNGFIFFVCFVSGILLMVLLVQENTIRLDIHLLHKVTAERTSVEKQVAVWQQVVKKYPDYRDAYIQLSLLEYKLGDRTKALSYDEEALRLDPNFELGRELEHKIMN